MHNGTISANNVTAVNFGLGGGVSGNFIMHNGAISNNTVSAINTSSNAVVEVYGGGVSGNLTMHDGRISGNTVIAGRTRGNNSDVYAFGGGVSGPLTMNGGTISGNTVIANNNVNPDRAAANGGGVYARSSFIKTGGTIYGNYAADGLGNIAIGGLGHAVYHNVFGRQNSWRNASTGPNDNSARLDFWLNEIDITYSVIHNDMPPASLTFTFSGDPGNLLSSHITLCENVSGGNASLTGSGNSRTLSPISVSGNGIITVSILSMYGVETCSKNILLIPDPPIAVATTPSASTVTLNWDPVFLATGYRVYRSTSASSEFTHLGTTSSTAFTDIRLSHSTPYFYSVTAFNSAGVSVVLAQASATTLSNNTRLAIAASSDTVVVEWPRDRDMDIAMGFNNLAMEFLSTAVGIPGSVSYRTSYVIYRNGIQLRPYINIPTRLVPSLIPPLFFTLVQDSSRVDHFFVDSGRSPNTTYNYRVAVRLYGALGILETFLREDDVMTVSATTLSDVLK
jgi:hypothetical protein